MTDQQTSISGLESGTRKASPSRIMGTGEMAAVIRSFDWSTTALGPLAEWSESFLNLVNVVLSSPIPMALYWGARSLLLYNDGYRPFAGVRHPASLGAPAAVVWREAWPILGPQVEAVLHQGKPTHHENLLVPLEVDGQLQDFYWTYSFSPAYENGLIAGVFNVCQSTTHSMQAEQRLRESERQARSVLRSIGDAVIVKDAKGNITRMNPVAEELTGWMIEETQGHPFTEVFRVIEESSGLPAENPADQARRLRRSVEFGQNTMLARRDGHQVAIDGSGSPIYGEDGHLTGIVVVFRKVEEKRQIERERAETATRDHETAITQELLLKLLQGQRETTDPKTMMLAAAEAVGRYLGVERTGFFDVVDDMTSQLTAGWTAGQLPPLIGKVPLAVLGERYLADARAGTTRAVSDYATNPLTREATFSEIGVRSGIGVPIIRHGRWQSGFYVHCASVREWTDAEVAFVREAANQTLESVELALSQQAVRRSEARARKILESIGDAVVVTDDHLKITGMNQVAETLTGWPVNEARGLDLTEVFCLVDEEGCEAAESAGAAICDLKAMRETKTQSVLARRDGTRRHIDHSGSPMREHDGRACGMVLTFRDITERNTTELRLRQAYKMEALGQLTGGIAHDFNNILAIIMGNLELIAEEIEMRSSARERIEQTITSAERAADLTRRLLAYARQQPLDPIVVDIVHLVNAAAEFIRRSLGPTIVLRVTMAENLWAARIDRNQFENALLNLAVNARDAMPHGGQLHIECSNFIVAHIVDDIAGELVPGEYLLIAVTDTGTGMSDESLTHATEPFYTTKAIGQGTGLGLSMVYGFLKQSGGHMRIESELSIGTRVMLFLPRALSLEGQSAAGRAHKLPVALPRGNELVLVVEDELAIRRTIGYLLNSLGYRVLEAEDGPAAMVHLQDTARIDLLLTDVVLPNGISGPALANEGKILQPEMKTIFSSGYNGASLVRDYGLEPGVPLLNKPFHLAELARMTRDVLDSASL